MRMVRWLGAAAACGALLLQTAPVEGQRDRDKGHGHDRDNGDEAFGMTSWNIELFGGASRYGRFLLSSPEEDVTSVLQREVGAATAWHIGGAVGATVLPGTEVRATFTHSPTDLRFRDDTGTGDEGLDQDDIGNLTSEIVTLEVTRFFDMGRFPLTPFVGAGVVAAWWGLDEATAGIEAAGESSQFRWGGTGTIGAQARLGDAFRLRLGVATSGIGNPFTGSESYRLLGDRVIDEPNRVTKMDFRLGLAYVFGGNGRLARR